MYIYSGKVKTKIENFKGKLDEIEISKKLKKNALGTMMVVTLISSAGCGKSFSTTLEAQGYTIETMQDENDIEKPEIEYRLPMSGIALTSLDGVVNGYDITVYATESIKANAKEDLVYDLRRIEAREVGEESIIVRTNIPVGEFVNLTPIEAGNYIAEIKGVTSGQVYGVTSLTSTDSFGPSHGMEKIEIEYRLPMSGIALTSLDGVVNGYDITVYATESIKANAKEDLVYDLRRIEAREVGEESIIVRTNIPVGEFVNLTPIEAGNYIAEIKGVTSGEVYGVTSLTSTDSFGPSHGMEKIEIEYRLPMSGIALTSLNGVVNGYDITVYATESIKANAKEDLVYDLRRIEAREVGEESIIVKTNIPVGEFVNLLPIEAGNYIAEIKGAISGQVYGVTSLTSTDSFGPSYGMEEEMSFRR